MGKTFSTGLLTNGIWQDASNNIGIGGSPSGSYKLEVTGTAKVSGAAYFGTASGSVGIGTTTTDKKLSVKDSTAVQALFFGYTNLGSLVDNESGEIQLGSNNTYAGRIAFSSAGSTTLSIDSTYNGNASVIQFRTKTNATAVTAMTILGSGNVGIGTSSPASKLDISGGITLSGNGTQANNTLFTLSNGYMYLDGNTNGLILENNSSSSTRIRLEAADNMQFQTASTERMRITSGGSVGIGNTGSSTYKLLVTGNTTDGSTFSFYAFNSANVDLFGIRTDGAIYTGAAGNSPYNLTTPSAANCFINTNGYLYRSTSSLKYKKNIQDYTKGLAEVLQLRPVSYESINEEEAGNIYAGLIAEEVHDLGLTEFVQYRTDGTPDALSYANMIALLTKAIQELSSQNQDLKSRLDKAGL